MQKEWEQRIPKKQFVQCWQELRKRLHPQNFGSRKGHEIWCIDLAYVDKLAKDIDDVMSFLVRQDLFDRTVPAKGMKTKDAKENVRAFLTTITKKNRPKKIWVDKGTEIAG